VSRISHGQIELRRGRIELASAAQRAIEIVRPLTEAMGHELTVVLPSEPVYLDADAVRLAQIIGATIRRGGLQAVGFRSDDNHDAADSMRHAEARR